jgi:hypothetical protein
VPPVAPEEPPVAVGATPVRQWSVSCDARRKTTLREARPLDDADPFGVAAPLLHASPLLGISAPAPPSDKRPKHHIRRKPAEAVAGAPLHPGLAKSLDAASYDARACAQVDGRPSELVLTLSVEKGAVKVVDGTSTETVDQLSACLMQIACDIPVAQVPDGAKAAFALHIRPMHAELAKVDVLESANKGHANIVGPIVREAATGCEQGQITWREPRSADLMLTASPHSSVQPTVNYARTATSQPAPDQTLLECLEIRLDGYRLPLDPWHGVDPIRLRVTWGNQ